jgi:23S rRNA pseudouridine1911/1915/1917 synthase
LVCAPSLPKSAEKLNDRTEFWIVEPNVARMRLDQFLASQLSDESRSQIQNWIRKGYVTVNGESVKTGHLIRLKDAIALKIPLLPPNQPFPENIPLDVLYEDSDLAVIHKQAGIVCHIGAGVRSGTLVNALLHHMGSLETGDPVRPGIVHRLDKFTSGVMLVAKNNISHRHLSQQFKSRQIRKEYLALVHGSPSPAQGTIDIPIGRDSKNRKKMSPRAYHKRSAITHYSVKESFGFVSLLDVRIDTGRTHQIRVHLAHKGHPIVGDTLYGGNRIQSLPDPIINAAKIMQRPFLHSSRLSFSHPRSGESLSFHAPLPKELQDFLKTIRSFHGV